MRLAPLLTALPDDELDRLAIEHVRTDEKLPRPQLCNFLEGALRSYRFVNEFIVNRQPPSFAILTLLLDAPGYALPVQGFPNLAMDETRRIADLIDKGEILARDDGLRLYRRALHEARRNDLDLNSSEAALLAVLRREAKIAPVEHFLLEHHQDLREFWDREHAFFHEQNALRSAGLVFAYEGQLLIAEDVAPAIRQTLGIDMSRESARRLFDYVRNADLAGALDAAGARTAGSKEARIERLLTEWIQPRSVLRTLSLGALKDVCRAAGASSTGNKDELIERLVAHFAQGKDEEVEPPPSPPRQEERALDEERFRMLFGFLTAQELTDILRRFPDLRQSGTKDVRVATLWGAHLAEKTLLAELMNRDLEDILHRLSLRLGGSKPERIARIIEHFALGAGSDVANDGSASSTVPDATATLVEMQAVDPEIVRRQEMFRQRASDLQNALQPWLEEILGAQGKVKCYATEVPNPTQQLKNKLSQAVAARGGVLVLVVADEASFARAHEALVQRWGTNDEWMKSVACVALAYPMGAPAIEMIVEWTDSPWPGRIRERLFPWAAVARAHGSDTTGVRPLCFHCEGELPGSMEVRFCPHCGRPVSR